MAVSRLARAGRWVPLKKMKSDNQEKIQVSAGVLARCALL